MKSKNIQYFMVVIVKWNFNLFVDGSQSLTLADKFETSAYDKISVVINEGSTNKTVEVQPSDIDKVEFLCIKSDQYHIDTNKKLVYRVGESTKEIALERAHVLIGSSLVGMLEEAPKTLAFSNSTGKDANIEIIIGRKAVS